MNYIFTTITGMEDTLLTFAYDKGSDLFIIGLIIWIAWIHYRKFVEFQQQMDAMTNKFDRKFDQVDRRFDQIDHRFDQIDQKIEAVDKKLTHRVELIEYRLDRIEGQLIETNFKLTIVTSTLLAAGIITPDQLSRSPQNSG